MRYGSVRRSIWIEAAVVSLLVAGAVAAFVEDAASPMDRDELAISAADLRTLSSAAKRLADQFLAGQLTETFFQEQSSLLYDQVKSSHEELESGVVEPGLEKQRANLTRLAVLTEEQVAALENGDDVRAARDSLAELFGQFKESEDGLKH